MADLGFDETQYFNALKQLLPLGPAWELEDTDLRMRCLFLCAQELARIDADILAAIDESDPRTASKTLQEWFDEWGIPDDCLKLLGDMDIEQYRKVLLTKITTLGYTFSELVKYIGANFGFDNVSIGLRAPFRVSSRVNERIFNYSWQNWIITATSAETNITRFRVDNRASIPLAQWGNELFECLIKSFSPAHKGIIFNYGETAK